MAIDRYTVKERCTKITLKRGFTVLIRLIRKVVGLLNRLILNI